MRARPQWALYFFFAAPSSTTSINPFTFGPATVCVLPVGQVTSTASTFAASPRPK